MAGTKRSADTETSPRATKYKKTADGDTPAKGKKAATKKGAKAAIPTSEFKSKALPLHVNITHTPPTLEPGKTPIAKLDPGHLGGLTLVATSFSTGSYGWKGAKRMTIELQNDESGEKEKVTVMLNINATVVGSKDAKKDAEGKDEADDDAEDSANEADEE
ncbi:hypothetical protein MKEN_01128900 [Mycena kentingensis (nom. inval.)]|nr:hypothetical protein MKEN_01128900 [Mycena kentingensis (nom. inval.)]